MRQFADAWGFSRTRRSHLEVRYLLRNPISVSVRCICEVTSGVCFEIQGLAWSDSGDTHICHSTAAFDNFHTFHAKVGFGSGGRLSSCASVREPRF